MEKKLVYFLCTGNSCRSQMADGFLNALGSNRYEVQSAGLEAHGLNPRAVKVMQEAGVDISQNKSKTIDPEILNRAAYVITLCGHADEHCPVISNKNVIKWHWGFDDPAKATGTEDEIMDKFREVRDSIKARIQAFVNEREEGEYVEFKRTDAQNGSIEAIKKPLKLIEFNNSSQNSCELGNGYC